MKVLHIIPSLYRGGAERLVLDICIELQKREGVEVKLVSFSNENSYQYLSTRVNHTVIPSSVKLSKWGADVTGAGDLKKFIEEFNPHIIHSHLFQAEFVSRSITFPQAKYFSHCHDNMKQFAPFSLKTLINRRQLATYYERLYMFKRYEANGGNRFIVISKNSYNYYQHVLPQRLQQIFLLPNAINTARFNKPVEYTPIPRAAIQLVTIGQLDENKNQRFLLDVVRRLKRDHPNVHLHILGDGNNRKRLAEKALALGISQQVTFHGIVPNVEEFLWNSDIYVHAARSEAFGLVFVEAMAAGLPVVSLNGGGNRDIVNEGVNGFMQSEHSVTRFIENIMRLVNDKKLYSDMSNAALQTSKEYDIVNYTDKLLSLYTDALKS